MIYLRDNNGVFEASLDNITWEAVVLGTGGGGATDHTLLTNIGTNTHAQIDTHLASTIAHMGEPIHATGGVYMYRNQLRNMIILGDGGITITLPILDIETIPVVFRVFCLGTSLRIDPDDADFISFGGTAGTAGQAAVLGEHSCVLFAGIDGEWSALDVYGTLTLET